MARQCAREGETCSCSGTVAFVENVNTRDPVADAKDALLVADKIACTASAFGKDPALGRPKACFCYEDYSVYEGAYCEKCRCRNTGWCEGDRCR